MIPDHTSMLSALDPAPERLLAPDEEIRREQLLHRVLNDRASTSAHSVGRPRSRAVLWAVGGLAAMLTVTAVVGGPLLRGLIGGSGGSALAAVDVASWTSTAALFQPGTKAGTAAEDWCIERSVGDPENTARRTIVSAELRGRVSSLIFERGDEYTLCMVGLDGGGFAELLDPPTPVGADEVKAMTGGGHGNDGAGFDYFAGRAGDAVTRVILTTDGRKVEARIEDGWWTVWWPNPHVSPSSATDVTITLSDGTTRTGPLKFMSD